ncbi:MAG: hypothetical protein WA738_07900 [Candidatus Angelobacter sp.]
MKLIRSMILVGACLFALAAFAQQNPPSNENEHGQKSGQHMGAHQMPSVDDHLKDLSAKLNLTADQQAKIRPILEDTHQQMQSLMSDQSMSKEDKHAKMQSLHESVKAKVSDILNADQKKQFAAMMQEHEHQGATKGGHEGNDHK